MKRIKNISIVLLVITVGILGGMLYLGNTKEPVIEINTSIVEEKLQSISELSVLSYHYQNVASYKSNKQWGGFSLPFTTKSFLIVYSGYIKAGTELENARIEVNEGKQLVIALPPSKILDNVINEEDIVIYDENSAIFNKLEFDDLFSVLIDEKEKLELEVIEKGFLEDANMQVKKLVEGLFSTMDFDEIIVDIR